MSSEVWKQCPDCGTAYVHGMPHYAFCVKHTCEECLAGYPKVLPVANDGRRLCVHCTRTLNTEALRRVRELDREIAVTKAALKREQGKFSRELEAWKKSRLMESRVAQLEKQLARQKRKAERLERKLNPISEPTKEKTGRVFCFQHDQP